MKDLNEELKALRENEDKSLPSLEDIEEMAERLSCENSNKQRKPSAKISRLLPECYTTFTFTNINIKALHEETLFFIFYALVESELQIQAYNELIQKGYVFSKALDGFVFFDESPVLDNKRRKILYFDPFEWEKCLKEVVFDEKFIDTLECSTIEIK